MKIISLIFIFSLGKFAFAQKQGNNWYFGEYAGLTFNSGKSIALTNSRMKVNGGGTATISNSQGRLLFYSDGFQVWDSAHTSFVSGLKGNDVNYQAALFVPHPDSSHLYFIFTSSGAQGIYPELYYSVINTKLRSGRGDIVSGQKNVSLGLQVLQKLTSVRHANRRDYWVVTQKYKSDSIYSFLITPYGLSKTPVISRVYKPSNSSSTSIWGVLKLSPDGKRICSLNFGDTTFIADFDASTGKISNPWLFKDVSFGALGMEYSAKSKYLYTITQGGPGTVYQYDLSAKTKDEFLKSRKTIDSGYQKHPAMSFGLLQLGPDGKIYIPVYDDDYLHVIDKPDMEGLRCDPKRDYIYLGNKTNAGLPDMVQSFFQKKTFNLKSNCSRDTVFFSISNTYDLDSAKWDFGDTTKGSSNFSNKTSGVYHCYKNPGTYTARLISYHKQFIDTIYEMVEVNYKKPFLGSDKSYCNTFKTTLSPLGDYKTYQWNGGGAKTKSINVNKGGAYTIKVTDYDGCISSDTIEIKNPIVSASMVLMDSALCFKNNRFVMDEATSYKNDLRKKSTWYFSDGSFISDSTAKKSFNQPGSYSVMLVSESLSGCKDSLVQNLIVFSNASIGFTINRTAQCVNNNSYDFINTSFNIDDSLTFQWDLGDLQSSQKHYTGKVYKSQGNYSIRLITLSDKGCSDTLSKTISVLPSPKADFTWTGFCSRQAVNFNFSGTIPVSPVVTSYYWYFPDGDSSNLKNPSKLLTQPGINKVTLITKSDNGCESSITKDVEVLPQTKADFEAKDVCEDSLVFFNNTSIGGITYSWKFGDGNSSKNQSPRHQYIISGVSKTFNVSLLAIVPNGCSDSITKAVTVNANPKSDFNFTISGRLVSFTALENNATLYEWNFGEGGTANTANNNTSYHYTKSPSGKYTACLKVTNAANCFTETCKDINITGAINHFTKAKGITIYPNPNTGNFTIDIQNPQAHISIEVYDLLGHLIQQLNPPTSQSSYAVNINAANGIYIVRVKNGNRDFYQKVTIGR